MWHFKPIASVIQTFWGLFGHLLDEKNNHKNINNLIQIFIKSVLFSTFYFPYRLLACYFKRLICIEMRHSWALLSIFICNENNLAEGCRCSGGVTGCWRRGESPHVRPEVMMQKTLPKKLKTISRLLLRTQWYRKLARQELLTHYYVDTVGQCWQGWVVKECFYFPWSMCGCFIIQLNRTLPWEPHIWHSQMPRGHCQFHTESKTTWL